MGVARTGSVVNSLEIGANKVDQILCKFRGDLLLDPVDQMEADVRLQDLAHQAVYTATDGGKQHKLIAAVFVVGERSLNGVQLSAQFANPLHHLYRFSFVVGQSKPPLDYTHPRYSMNGVGV